MIILLILFIILAVSSLVTAIICSIKYGKLTGAKVQDTEGRVLPTSNISDVSLRQDKMDGYQFQKTAGIYKTKGKEGGISFSMKPQKVCEGLKNRDRTTIIQFLVFSGFVFFTVFTFCAIGTGLLLGNSRKGAYIFLGTGIGFGILYIYKVFFTTEPEENK